MLDLPKETIILLDLNTWDNFFFLIRKPKL